MKTLPAFGFVLAPFAAAVLALGSLLLVPAMSSGRASAAPEPVGLEVCPGLQKTGACPELVEMEVRDVIPLREAQTHAVVLVSKDKQVVLPIFVDEGAAFAIALRLAHRTAPQPLSQDLLDHMVSELGGQVTGVRIDDVHEHVFSTRVFLRQGRKYMGLNARPSDAVAMALAGGARIFATRNVVAQAGITRREIDELRRQQSGVGGSGPAPVVPPTGAKPEISL